jgi:hypothetical protein
MMLRPGKPVGRHTTRIRWRAKVNATTTNTFLSTIARATRTIREDSIDHAPGARDDVAMQWRSRWCLPVSSLPVNC